MTDKAVRKLFFMVVMENQKQIPVFVIVIDLLEFITKNKSEKIMQY